MSDTLEPSPTLRSDRPAASAEGLADRDKLAAIAVERTRMPMLITDPRQADNPVVLANRAFLSLTGYTSGEVIGRNCRFLQGAGTSSAAVAEMRAGIAEERDIHVEVLNYRKDGSSFWNQLNVSPIHDEHGVLLYFFASQIDVTELRRIQGLEASERRLRMEVDHRARNVLAIVNGVVRLSRSTDADRYAAAVQQRVQALAHAHSLLAERGWREVSLERIIRQQVHAFGPSRIRMDGPEVMVSASAVQPLSLVIHELATNAATHGALSAAAGELRVRWDHAPEHGGVRILWEETGGPAPAAERRTGFGDVMVRGLIESQLRGELGRTWTEGGLTVTMSVPGLTEKI